MDWQFALADVRKAFRQGTILYEELLMVRGPSAPCVRQYTVVVVCIRMLRKSAYLRLLPAGTIERGVQSLVTVTEGS